MEILFKQQRVDIEQDTERIMEVISELLGKDYYFSHLVADGQEIYEEPESFLSEHLQSINRLEVVAKTAQEFVNDVLLSAEDYIKRAVPELLSLSDEFYNSPSSESWDTFAQLLEGAEWLNQIIQIIDQTEQRPANWLSYLSYAENMKAQLSNLEEAVESHDFVLIADMIRYEISPAFEALGKDITTTIDTEGCRHDVN